MHCTSCYCRRRTSFSFSSTCRLKSITASRNMRRLMKLLESILSYLCYKLIPQCSGFPDQCRLSLGPGILDILSCSLKLAISLSLAMR
nr:hypothetical protein Q903MT_gene2719 [Picea sitchensis]